jgi:hypothetical protein
MSALSNVNFLPVVGNCISLSWQILQLLWTSKSNKHEHKSLQSALTNIRSFLEGVTADAVSPKGRSAYSKWMQLLMVLGVTAAAAAAATPAGD